MKRMVLFLLIAALHGNSQTARIAGADSIAGEVKKEFLHSWNAYKTFAWGSDGVKPISKTPYSWYGETLLVTPVDAFDTMVLMGLKQEAAEAQKLIDSTLSFDRNIRVKNFEITIRILGGLLSAYQLSGDEKMLSLAQELANRLLPAFDSPTGMPYVYINLATGKREKPLSNPAEIGTLLIEFGTLSKLTGNPVYYAKAKHALVELFKRRSAIGLVGETIDVETGKWGSTASHVGGMIDSYYEYLFKCWKLFGDEDCLAMWKESIPAVNRYVADTVRGELWYGVVDMNTGKRTAREFGGLEAFMPGLLAYSGDVERARELQQSCYSMWTAEGVEPEVFNYEYKKVLYPNYPLRPEIIESAYYLYRITGDTLYQRMGVTFFNSLKQYCRTEGGYAELASVITKEKKDMMESFFLAETMKYLYLLFADPAIIDLKTTVFNTEAHPIKRTW
ncbi:MAG: glycoside hydrolase family 47 protein [Bacteroidota bacterium]